MVPNTGMQPKKMDIKSGKKLQHTAWYQSKYVEGNERMKKNDIEGKSPKTFHASPAPVL